jgi:hypothetical protein
VEINGIDGKKILTHRCGESRPTNDKSETKMKFLRKKVQILHKPTQNPFFVI